MHGGEINPISYVSNAFCHDIRNCILKTSGKPGDDWKKALTQKNLQTGRPLIKT